MKSIHRLFAGLALALFATLSHAASLTYDNYLDKVFAGSILKTDTYKCSLHANTYTPNRVTHVFYSDLTNEITGTGYTAGGVTVVPTFTLDTTNHKITITFPQVQWTSSTLTARYLVCRKDTGTAATSPLVFIDDFGADVATTAGTFTVNASTITYNFP